uniref:Uncharacterized protein n=1 Tax=Tanacetum cinerariifolium TaxID=118510 RepID=A0A6L2M8T4_TANCI|nr:hypothetical protein [Tanacetum cinerariifolium]
MGVLDQGLDADLQADIIKYVEDLVSSGLRQRLISLIKESVITYTLHLLYALELNREDSAGLGGPNSERHILDSRGALVERRAVCRERLIIGHCLVLSLLVVRASPNDVKDIFATLDIGGSTDIFKNQDASFAREFQETVMAIGNDQLIEGCMHCIRLAWAVHLMIIQDVTDNDNEDMIYKYNAYLHKLVSSFLSHPFARDKGR